MNRLVLAIVVAVGLLAGLWLALPPEAAAGPYCPVSYTVLRGDTLSEIAARAGISTGRLAQINGIRDPDRIYAGQLLCLPPALGGLPAFVVQSHPSFDLVAEYTFTANAEPGADKWTLGKDRQAGRRLRYALASGDLITTVAEPAEVRVASVKAGTPILWVARSQKTNPYTYTLVVIGDPTPLLDLQLGVTRSVTEILSLPTPAEVAAALADGTCPPASSRPATALLNSAISTVRLRVELVGDDGTFIPVSVDAIDYQPSADAAELCYPYPGFALHRAADPGVGGYRLFMVLNDDGTIGPPGDRWRMLCRQWQGGGWWSRFLAAWYGCRRR